MLLGVPRGGLSLSKAGLSSSPISSNLSLSAKWPHGFQRKRVPSTFQGFILLVQPESYNYHCHKLVVGRKWLSDWSSWSCEQQWNYKEVLPTPITNPENLSGLTQENFSHIKFNQEKIVKLTGCGRWCHFQRVASKVTKSINTQLTNRGRETGPACKRFLEEPVSYFISHNLATPLYCVANAGWLWA